MILKKKNGICLSKERDHLLTATSTELGGY